MNTSKAAIACLVQAGVPVLVTGDPGIGKSSYFRGLAALMGAEIKIIVPSSRDETDFGIPFVSGEGEEKVLESVAPRWAHKLAQAPRGLLFLDEANTGTQMMQAAMMSMMLEGTVSDFELGPHVSRVMVINPAEIAPNGSEFSAPMSNRVVHLGFEVNTTEWLHGMRTGDWNPEGYPVVDMGQLPQNERVARGLVAAFIESHRALLMALPKDESLHSEAWPSPRSWDMLCARGIAALLSAGFALDSDEANIVVLGSVGQGAGMEFMSWLRTMDLPSPQEILANAATFKLPNRGDYMNVLLSNTTLYAMETGTLLKKHWNALWDVYKRASEAGFKDVVMGYARQAAAAGDALKLQVPVQAATLAGLLQHTKLKV